MTRNPRQLEDLAKILTYMLCHRPDEFGLVVAAQGFVSVKGLLQALSQEPGWGFVRRHHLEQVAGLLHPPRFELAAERFRALPPGGVNLRRPGDLPPPLLYLAIPPKIHPRVFEEGLRAPPGQELLLATAPERALELGRRRSPDPVLVTIQAQAAARGGVVLQGYGEGLFLAAAVPREYLQVPPVPEKRQKPKTEKAPAPSPPPGSVLTDLAAILGKPPQVKGKDKKGEPAWKAGTRVLRRERRRTE